MRLYFSADLSDYVSAIDIRTALDALLPGDQLDYWDPSAPTDTERRVQGKQYMESADVFIALYSADYFNSPDTRWELMAALAEKVRRPDQFYIVTVLARHAVIAQELLPFEVLPASDESLEGPQRDAQVVRVAYALADIFKRSASQKQAIQTYSLTEGLEGTMLTLPDLRERLLERIDRANPSDAMSLLKSITYDAGLMRRILQIEDDFVSLHQHQRHELTEYKRLMQELKVRMEQIVSDIQEEQMLFNNWRTLFLKGYYEIPSRETLAFFLPVEDIVLPETLNLPIATQDIGSAERVGLLSFEQKLEFRRLLLLCRDALELGKFAAAHTYAEQVRTQIDPESAQLYEYLLLSFIKKEGPLPIMRRLLDGIPSGFRHIKLYSDRCQMYQESIPPRCPSTTVEHNCFVAAEELSASLNNAFSNLPHHAICNTGLRLDETYRPAVKQCIEAAFALHESLVPTKVMPETLILELLGAEKYTWMKRMDVSEGTFLFVGNSDFDLPGKIAELLNMLQASDGRREPWKQREMLREDLFWLLLKACEQLSAQVLEENRQKQQRTDLRRSMIHIVQSCILGHHCLTQPGDALEDEKSLLRLAVEILLPNLTNAVDRYRIPEVLSLDWFTLDVNGNLQPSPACRAYDFDAKAIIEQIIADHAGQSAWMQVAPNIKEEVWLQYVAETAAIRAEVADGLQWSDFRRMHPLTARKKMILYLHRSKVCALAYPERSAQFTEMMLQELCGEGLLMWFGIHAMEIYTHPDCDLYRFDAKRELEHLLLQPQAWSEEKTSQVLVGHLFNQYIEPAYKAIQPGNESQRAATAQLLQAALLAFQKHPYSVYLDLVYNEIVNEVKFKWIDIAPRGQWVNISPMLDATAILIQLTRVLPLRFDPIATRRQLADNRLNEQMARYFKEISEIRHENRLPERKIVAEIIWRLKALFLFYPDLKYLELVRKELYDMGRIRWYGRWLGVVKLRNASNHHDNSEVYFDYKAERVELAMYEQDVSRLFGLMMEEMGFNYSPL